MNKERQLHGKNLLNWISYILSCFRDHGKLEFYAILNGGQEFKPSLVHEILPVSIDSQNIPNYFHIAGLGDKFANLFIANEQICKLRKSGKIDPNARIYVHEALLAPDFMNSDNRFQHYRP